MGKIEKFKVLLNGKSEDGTEMKFSPETGEIFLIPVEGGARTIGKIQEEGDGQFVYKKREEEQHRHRKTDGWTINTRVLRQVDIVEYESELAVYRMHRSDIFARRVYGFSPDGVDHKTFVPANRWEHIKFKDPVYDILSKKIGSEWVMEIGKEFKKPYMTELNKFLWKARKSVIVYPEPEDVFAAFKITSPSDIKVVILGQDPYHNGSAHGLAFSSKSDKIPASLGNIFKEIEQDVGQGLLLNQEPDLTRWAEQGVFLLNTILTVEEGKPLSHVEKGWETFTREILKVISSKYNNVVYLLWGKYAQNFEAVISSKNNLVLKAPHPSPYSASSGFFGCRHFSQTNRFLVDNKIKPIQW